MNLAELSKAVAESNLSSADLIELSKVLHECVLARRRVEAIATKSTLKVGARVRLHSIRPRHLCGQVGTVLSIAARGSRVDVRLDGEESWRRHGIPATCLEVVESETAGA